MLTTFPKITLSIVSLFICLLFLWPSTSKSTIISTPDKQKLYIARYSNNELFYILKDIIYIYNYESDIWNSYPVKNLIEIYKTVSCWYFQDNNVDYFATYLDKNMFILQKVQDDTQYIKATFIKETLESALLYDRNNRFLVNIYATSSNIEYLYYSFVGRDLSSSWSSLPTVYAVLLLESNSGFIYIAYYYNEFGVWNNGTGPRFPANVDTKDLFAMKMIHLVQNKYVSCFILGNYDVGCLSIEYNHTTIWETVLVQVGQVWQPGSEIDLETFWLLKISDNKAIVACYTFTNKKFVSKLFNFALNFALLIEIETDYFNFVIKDEVSIIGVRSHSTLNGYEQDVVRYFVQEDSVISCSTRYYHQFSDWWQNNEWWPTTTMILLVFIQLDTSDVTWLCNWKIVTSAQPCEYSKITFWFGSPKVYEVEYQSSNRFFWTRVKIIACADNCLTCTEVAENKCKSCITDYYLKEETGECDLNANKFQLDHKVFMILYYEFELEIDFIDDFDEIMRMGYQLQIEGDSSNKGIFLDTNRNPVVFPYTVFANQMLYNPYANDLMTSRGYIDIISLIIKKDGIDYSVHVPYYILVCSFGCTCSIDWLSNDCLDCIEGHNYFSNDTTKCYSKKTKEKNWYLSDEKKYETCHYKCATCLTGEVVGENNCDSCVDGYFFIQGNGKNCFDTLPSGDYVLDVGTNTYIQCTVYSYVNENNNIVCVDECPKAYPYWNKDKCVHDCSDLIMYWGKCLDTCPSEALKILGECFYITKSNETGKQSVEIKLDENEIIDEFWTSPSPDIIKDLLESNTQIKGENTILEFVTSFDKEYLKDKGVSSINLGDCEMILKTYYNIDPSEYLIIAKLDIFTPNTITPQVEYSVFRKDGQQLQLILCEGTKVEVSSPINPDALPSLNMTQSFEWYEQGIDVFNSSSPFFNDICIPYTTNGTDVNWKDRRNDIFQDIAFCEVGCEYKGINYNNNKITCKCEIKLAPSAEERKKESNNEFISALSTINIWIIKCIWQLGKPWNYKDNKGFYIIWFIWIIQIVMVVWYSLRSKWLLYQPWFKYSNKCILTLQKTSQKDLVSEVKTNYDNNIDKEDLNDLCFGHAVRFENRKFIRIWVSVLFNNFDIYSKMIKSTEFDIFSVNISIFLFNWSIDFTLNAMFFTDDVVSERYHNGGSISFTSTLLLAVLSNIVGFIFAKGVDYFSNYSNIWVQLVKETSMESQFNKIARRILLKIKIRLFIFFVFEFVVMSFCLFYIMWFCIIYKQSQVTWLLDCLVGNLISIAITVTCAFLVSVFRVIGLRKNKKVIYNISLYLNGSIG